MVLPHKWSTEARALVALALPLVIGNLAWSLIAATDLLLIGHLGADAVAATALALNLYNGFMIVGMGVGMAMSPMIASERGRKPHSVRDIRRTVRQAVWAVVTLCLPIWLILWHSEAVFLALGQAPDLSAKAATLMRGLQWALLPFLMFFVARNFMGALERPIWGVIIVLVALPFNLLVGWAFIFGHLGLPALGLFGAGLASSISAVFMLVSALFVVSLDRGFRRYHLLGRFWVADWLRYAHIWKLGLPIAVTLAFEVTVFNASAFLMGLLGRAELAAHAIAIQIAALCFMVPMGIGQAATIRVGLRFGQNDAAAVARAGWIAVIIGVAFSAATALVLLVMPRSLIGIFIDVSDPLNAQVVAIGVTFLAVAALFQLVDSTQVIVGGALRGLHDTKVPMIFAAVGYWGIGIGVGIFLAFRTPMGGVGIWLGLALGLAVVAVMMIARWMLRKKLRLV